MTVFHTISFDDLIRYGLALVIIAASLLAILYTVWGGFLMIISGGQEEKVKKAVNHIRHAAIGIGFIVVVFFVFPLIAKMIGLAYGEYATPASVFDTITEISNILFDTEYTDSTIIPGSPSTLPSNFSDL